MYPTPRSSQLYAATQQKSARLNTEIFHLRTFTKPTKLLLNSPFDSKMSDDLFSCFGSDEEDENDTRIDETQAPTDSRKDARDATCGVLSFHPNTEQSLLIHLKNKVLPTSGAQIACTKVLAEIDSFCIKRHWMMHVGPEKGDIIASALQDAIDQFVSTAKHEPDESPKSFYCAELGTYCGYGSILLAKVLLHNAARYKDIKFHLYTVEINPTFREVATEAIKLAQLDDMVSLLEIDLNMDGTTSHVGELLRDSIGQRNEVSAMRQPHIQFLMIDHDKDKYLEDLLLIEESGLIGSGSVVCADNVLFAKIDDYVQFQRNRPNIVSTETKKSMVEYCSPSVDQACKEEYVDGVGE